MVDRLSIRSGTAGVADGTSHKQSAGGVEEGQTTSRRFLSHHGDDLRDAFWLLALIRPPCVHLRRLGAALARRCWLDAETLQEFG
jgi:hypothetical protein